MASTVFTQEFTVPQVQRGTDGQPAKSTDGGLGTAEVRFEDGGQSMQVHPWPADGGTADTAMFVRLMSWSEGAPRGQFEAHHPALTEMLGKRCRVTVEVLD